MPRDLGELIARPTPAGEEDIARWEYTALVHRMHAGAWREDAETRLASFFHKDIIAKLPSACTARNLKLNIDQQKSLAYDEDPTVRADATPEDMARLIRPTLWPLQQSTLLHVNGWNESLMRLDWFPGKGLSYTVVTSDFVIASAPSEQPDQPNYVEELRWREGGVGWTWAIWDLRDPEDPKFRIDGFVDGVRTDITADLMDGRTDWPYLDSEGKAVFPYVLYHSKVGNQLWSPYRGSEVTYGTLTGAALWTEWLSGFRDGAHPQRILIDGEISTGRTVNPHEDFAGKPVVIAMDQTGIMEVKSTSDLRPASIAQYDPAMDPENSARGIEIFEAGLAVYAGVAPADTTPGTSSSGYALVISREGQRQAQKRLEPPMRMGDQLLLSRGAKILNRQEGTKLPENPEDYQITYHRPKQSPGEIKADIDKNKMLREAGLISPADAYRVHNPGATDEQAMASMLANAAQEAELRAGIAALTEGPSDADTVATLNELSLTIERLARIEDPELVNTIRGQLADALGTARPADWVPPSAPEPTPSPE